MRRSCAGLKKSRGYGQPVHLGAQTGDDVLDAYFALIEGLERGVDESAIAARRIAAGVSIYIGHRQGPT